MLTVKQHQSFAPQLRQSQSRWERLFLEISRMFGRQSTAYRNITKICSLFSSFKSELDNDYWRVVERDAPNIYYGGADQYPPLSEYLNEDVSRQKTYFSEISECVSKSGSSTTKKHLVMLLDAMSVLEATIHQQPKLKRRISNDIALLKPWPENSIPWPAPFKESKPNRDFREHECEHCRPLAVDENGHVTLPAYAVPSETRLDCHSLVVWCKYCWTFHSHGGGSDPTAGTGDGPRVPHCTFKDELGAYKKDYLLKCVGFITHEINAAHRADRRIRESHVKKIRAAGAKKRTQAYIRGKDICCGQCVETVIDRSSWNQSILKSNRHAYAGTCEFCKGLVWVHINEVNLARELVIR